MENIRLTSDVGRLLSKIIVLKNCVEIESHLKISYVEFLVHTEKSHPWFYKTNKTLQIKLLPLSAAK